MKERPKELAGREAEQAETHQASSALAQAPRTFEQLVGMLGEPSRKLTIEEMDEAIAERVREKFLSNREEP